MQPPHMRVMTIMSESNEWEMARGTDLTLAHDARSRPEGGDLEAGK